MYHLRVTFATAGRILQQLSHDHRTLGLIFVVPCLLLALLAWIFSNNERMFDTLGPSLLAIFPMIIMFLITSIATLRERTSGTLERILTMPIGKVDILLGYAIAFGLLAVVQASLASAVSLYLLGMDVAGPEWMLVVIALSDALLGTALGLMLSAFARSEFQAVQFMPAFILPQLLLCGLIVPLTKLPDALEFIARLLPMTYAVEAMQNIATETTISSETQRDLWIVLNVVIIAVVLGALTLKRRSR
jgi:ABC-2 type transport system permease protein